MRVYSSESRNVIPVFVYYVNGNSKQIYYATGTEVKPSFSFTSEGISEPYLQQLNIQFTVGASIEIEFGDAGFAALITPSEGDSQRGWTFDQIATLRQSPNSPIKPPFTNHYVFIVGKINHNGAYALSVGRQASYYQNNPSSGIVAHELGHNLGIVPHEPNTFMHDPYNDSQRTADAVYNQVQTVRPLE